MKSIELIVEAKISKEQEMKLAAISRIKYVLPAVGLYVVQIPEVLVNELSGIEGVDSVRSSTYVTAQSYEPEPTGQGVTIAILDTGVAPVADFSTPAPRILAAADFVNGKTTPYDDNGHGTHVAGVAAGSGFRSGGRHAGMAPGARLVAVKVLDDDGRGNSTDALAGIQWIIDNRKKYNIRVANLSIGTKDSGISCPLVRAVEAAWDAGIVMVIAAGNNGPAKGSITSPGTSRKVVTVGASDDHTRADIWGSPMINYSGRGPTTECIIKPDIIAPGCDIISTLSPGLSEARLKQLKVVDEYYVKMSGTSMASPRIAGAIALLLERFPHLSPDQVKLRLKNSAICMNHHPNRQGWGMLDVEKFLCA